MLETVGEVFTYAETGQDDQTETSEVQATSFNSPLKRNTNYSSFATADRQVQMSDRLYCLNHPVSLAKKELPVCSLLRALELTAVPLLSASRLGRLCTSMKGLFVWGFGKAEITSESSFFAGMTGLCVGTLMLGTLANRN